MSTVPMKPEPEKTGSCLCGGVRYTVTGEMREVTYCHCSQCRKTSGHYVAASSCDIDALQLVSDDTLTWYRASDIAQRGFCNICGGNLFWKPDHDRRISIFAGTIDTPTGLKSGPHIFVDDKSDYVTLADDQPQFPQSD